MKPIDRDSFDPDAAAQGSGIFGLPHTPEEARVVLIPVPWDATTSYRGGAARAPAAIRSASAQVDLFDVEMGCPYAVGIALLDEAPEIRRWNDEARNAALPIIARGGRIDDPALASALTTVNALGASLNTWVRACTERWLDADKIVAVLGGDHSTPYGAIEALSTRYSDFGILHIDAHADLRPAYEGFEWSHASIMHNVMTRLAGVQKLVQVGVRDLGRVEHQAISAAKGRIVTYFDAELATRRFAGATWLEQCQRILESLPKNVYVSFDIDGLDPSYCPNTGTPVPGGLSFQEANALLALLAKSGRVIVGFDLNEVAPGADSEWDANVGARLLYKLIGWTLYSRGEANTTS